MDGAVMAKLYVNEGTFGVQPWGAPTGKPRGRPPSTGQYCGDEGKAIVQSAVRILELDAIIRSGRTLKRAG
jgi:hypothetical protein